MGIELWIATPTRRWQRTLRRYASSWVDSTQGAETRCEVSGYGYHNAVMRIDDTTVPPKLHEKGYQIELEWPHDDPRWPATCLCGYAFTPEDHWQTNQDELFTGPDGQEFTRQHSPVGSMCRVPWMDRGAFMEDPPEEAYFIRLPGGWDWTTTESSLGGGRWEVTGTAPKITVSPSIFCNPNGHPPGWHGWIRNGVMEPA